MPVYLCQSGSGEPEPWRYGIQVYLSPFPVEVAATTGAPRAGRDLVIAARPTDQQPTSGGHPIRRVRHAEVVLVDDVCVAYERYWLRLRWPGSKGGFAGYIAMDVVSGSPATTEKQDLPYAENQRLQFIVDDTLDEPMGGPGDDSLKDDQSREEDRQETGSMSPSEPLEAATTTHTLTCLRTGIPFQSASAMKLLDAYDDGFQPPAALPSFFATEPVFCRICREGLHDDADEDQPAPASAADGEDGERELTAEALGDGTGDDAGSSTDAPSSHSARNSTGPVQPHPSYIANGEALQNPFLAPCECAGSMAFVHYLCVEQWRCRSRHPKAMNGLNCETCGAAYTLPPPMERPTHFHQVDQEDWLDAMPPHVMQALRQPHICWQMGAAMVRRRWLRPLAPIVMSPIVALYCRARRLLKKRGVSRRRWACSLCRRRARWKCVRCLRSYYCSRQCQNVSWHILHKHVCYKPSRLWASVLVYGAATLALFPGILRDPLMYDLGLCLIPMSFVMMGVIGGGIAMATKKFLGLDVRGRFLELIVLACTLYLSAITWGLVKGFFGDSTACLGAFGEFHVSANEVDKWYLLHFIRRLVLRPGQAYYRVWDNMPQRLNRGWIQAALCTGPKERAGCFEHLPNSNPDFFLDEQGGGKCAADLLGFTLLNMIAALTFAVCAFWKHQERQRRRIGRRPVRGEIRLHQD